MTTKTITDKRWVYGEVRTITDGYHLCEGANFRKDEFGVNVLTCPARRDGISPDVIVNGDRARMREGGGYVHNNPECMREAVGEANPDFPEALGGYQAEKAHIEAGLFGE